MKQNQINNAKLGFLVIAGILFMIFTLYMIGQKKDLFQRTITIKTELSSASGIQQGNTVMFMGLRVGSVKSLEIASDTSIFITMRIDKGMKSFIKKNSVAAVTSDGLMGYKTVSIFSSPEPIGPIEDGDIIPSRAPVETDVILRSLDNTSTIIEKVSENLLEITDQLKTSENLQTLLSDTSIMIDLKNAIAEIRSAGSDLSSMAASGKNIFSTLEDGDGLVQQVFTDTSLSMQLASTIDKIELASQQTILMLDDIKKLTENLKQGEGTAGMILTDSLMRKRISNSAANIEEGFEDFNQIMDAIKQSFLFRGYFRRLESPPGRNGKKEVSR